MKWSDVTAGESKAGVFCERKAFLPNTKGRSKNIPYSHPLLVHTVCIKPSPKILVTGKSSSAHIIDWDSNKGTGSISEPQNNDFVDQF